ncbi:MAG: uncharacterized protein PWP11_2637 [Thauera sp.]|nr:sulfite exporter TauE/SafE family protein [Thauera sp.]MDI3491360.1 uncharacterized protein [Thauera sp.]
MTVLLVGESTSVELAAIAAVMISAGFLHGVFGIGFAMIATPLLALWLDPREAVILAAVPLWWIAVGFLGRHFRQVLTCRHLFVLPGIVLGSLLGVYLQTTLSPRASWLLLAGLLVLGAVVPTLVHRLKQYEWRPAPISTTGFGFFAGMTESSLNVGAPLIVLYGGIHSLVRMEQLVILNLCFAIGKTVQLALTLPNVAHLTPISYLVVATITAGIGYVVGLRWMGKFSEQVFRRSLTAFLLVLAGLLTLRACLAS